MKVELVEMSTGDRELVLLKSGSGVDSFDVERVGSYRFDVEPDQADSRWEFTIKPIGLFNQIKS